MRFETINAASYLVWRLEHSGQVEALADDGDLILLRLRATSQQIMIFLIERGASLADLQHHLTANTERGIYSLFIYWADMLLPHDGAHYLLDDWMAALLDLHSGKIYGFEVAGREAYFFPVYFHGEGIGRDVRYGNVIDYGSLHALTVAGGAGMSPGPWRIASFGAAAEAIYYVDERLRPLYALLELPLGASLDAVKYAYRRLARRYHPDLNTDERAHDRMKELNQAYQMLLRQLTPDDPGSGTHQQGDVDL